MVKVNKANFDNSDLVRNASKLKILAWYFVSALIFRHHFLPVFGFKTVLLRLFGARIGKNFRIMPGAHIKYPWNFKAGDYASVGECAWIDNLAPIEIGDQVTISQSAMLLTGNHDYNSSSFATFVKEIVIEEGVWICAKAIVCPGVTCKSHSVLATGSVATENLEPFSINFGIPAKKIRDRELV